MASAFRPESTTVLNYGPSAHIRYRDNSQRYVLWPAYAYRVLAPTPTATALNLFQRAVLGCCNIGLTLSEGITAQLHLHKDLVTLIQDELIGQELLKGDLTLTEEGRTALHEDDTIEKIVTGYVFQDPWEHVLWPRFVTKLSFQEVSYDGESRYPHLVLGNKGNPRKRRPFVKLVDSLAVDHPAPPSPRDVVDACVRHRRQIHRRNQAGAYDEENDFSGPLPYPHPPVLERIEVLSDEPAPCLLVTSIFYGEGEDPQSGWHICDPFGLGVSRFLHRTISKVRKDDAELDRWLSGYEQKFLPDKNERELLELYQEDAKGRIRSRLMAADELPFFQELLQMELAFSAKNVELFFLRAGIVLEACFDNTQKNYPLSDTRMISSLKDRRARAELLNAMAKKFGYQTPLPIRYASISPGNLKRAATTGKGSITDRSVLLLASAASYPEHPLRRFADAMPDFFEVVDAIAECRNQSAHYSKDTWGKPDNFEEYRNRVLDIVEGLTQQQSTF